MLRPRLGASIRPQSRRLSNDSNSHVQSTKLNPGANGLSVTSSLKGVNHDFASTAPKERRNIRLPILINGAGPAGLILAIGLQNAKIPFEICEKHRHDLQTRPRRNHVSILSSYILKPLKDFLRAQTYRSFLTDIALKTRSSTVRDARNHDHSIHTESFLEMLRQHVPVNYGFNLEREGISSLESVITSQFITGQTIRTFQGSLLVGADSVLSAGNAPTEAEVRGFSLTPRPKLGSRSAFGPGLPLHTRRQWSSLEDTMRLISNVFWNPIMAISLNSSAILGLCSLPLRCPRIRSTCNCGILGQPHPMKTTMPSSDSISMQGISPALIRSSTLESEKKSIVFSHFPVHSPRLTTFVRAEVFCRSGTQIPSGCRGED